MPKATGAMGTGSNQHEVRFQNSTTPTLAEIGIDKKTSARARTKQLLFAWLGECSSGLVIHGYGGDKKFKVFRKLENYHFPTQRIFFPYKKESS